MYLINDHPVFVFKSVFLFHRDWARYKDATKVLEKLNLNQCSDNLTFVFIWLHLIECPWWNIRIV